MEFLCPMFRMKALGPAHGMKVFDSVHEMEILGPVLFHVHCVWYGPLAIETI